MEYSLAELRQMDEDTARSELTVNEFEQWEQLTDLLDEADETEQQFEAEAETVADVTVNADPEALGTRVDVFGNDLLVRIDPENRTLRQAAQRLDDEYGDVDADAADELEDDAIADLADTLLTMLDCVIAKWGETAWQTLDEADRNRILDDARAQWGIDGLFLAWGKIVAAVEEDREQTVGVVEKFRG